MKSDYPDDREIERADKFIEKLKIRNGKELTQIYLKSDVILLAEIFEKSIEVPLNEININPFLFVSLPGYTWFCGLKYTNIKLQKLEDKDMILLFENIMPGGISNVSGDRHVESD